MKTAAVLGIVLLLVVSVAAASFTFEYSEGELVSLVPEGQDDDADNVAFEYGAPLNESGEWQTTFDDAGTYDTFIRANDGTSTTEKPVTLIIKNVNRPPILTVSNITVDETDIVEVVPEVEDLDGDEVKLVFSLPLNAEGVWQTAFGDAGEHVIKVTARDAEATVERQAVITVTKKNQPPRILTAVPNARALSANEHDKITFKVTARDPEEQQLTVKWTVDDVQAEEGDSFLYALDYESAGTHRVAALVSDGVDTVEQEWLVTVADVNRAPSLEWLGNVRADENETIALNLNDTDADGDELSYSFSSFFSSDGVWTPSFDDAGVYAVTVTVTDGKNTTNKTITITVDGVDRAPEFLPVEGLEVIETEELHADVFFSDPDGDELAFDFVGPKGATFAEDEIIWTPDYDAVSKPDGFLLQLLQFFSIDDYFFPSEKKYHFALTACGAEKCTTLEFKVLVKGKNRPPVIEEIAQLEVKEGEAVKLQPVAKDPDNDVVHVTVGEPVGKRWITDFDSAGTYDVKVTASDGMDTTDFIVPLTVLNVNRAPTFDALSDKAVAEGSELSFDVEVQDADGDEILLVAEGMPDGASFDGKKFRWTPDFDVATKEDKSSTYLVTFSATDNAEPIVADVNDESANTTINDTSQTVEDTDSSAVKKTVQITVTDVNRAPLLTNVVPEPRIRVALGEPVVFKVIADDPDGDELYYTWDFGFLDSVESAKGVRRRFREPGDKKIVLTVSDGKESVEKAWLVRVSSRRQNATRTVEARLEAG